MSNIITAGNATNNGTSISSDTSGVLELKTGSTPTTALSIGTNQVVTFAQQPAGTFAGTGPAFSAYQASTDSISNSTWTKVSFQTENFDTNNNFSSSRFTPTVAGYYQINSSLILNTSTVVTRLAIYKNATSYCQSGMAGQVGVLGASGTVSSVVYLNGSSDYVEIYCYQTTGGTITTIAGLDITQFSGALLRAA